MGITIYRYTVKTSGASRTGYTFAPGSFAAPDGVVEGPPGTALDTLRGRIMLKVPKPGNALESVVFTAADAREEAIANGSRLRYDGPPSPVPVPAVAEAVVDLPVRVVRRRRDA